MKETMSNVACCLPRSGLLHYMTKSSSPVDYSVLRMNSDRHITGREVGLSYSTAVETTAMKQEDSLPPALKRYWCTVAQYAKCNNATLPTCTKDGTSTTTTTTIIIITVG